MAEQQTAEINSHKDIEALVNEIGGVRLYENFLREDGYGDNSKGSLSVPHSGNGQIYRFIQEWSEGVGVHLYGLVTENGDVTFSVGMELPRNPSGDHIRYVANRYSELKKRFDMAGVNYSPDADFEFSIIQAGKLLQG